MKKANKKSKTPPAGKRMAREISAEEVKQVSGGTGSGTDHNWLHGQKTNPIRIDTPPPAATNNNWIAQRSQNP